MKSLKFWKKPDEKAEVPEEWQAKPKAKTKRKHNVKAETVKPTTVRMDSVSESRFKIHIPYLLTFKRIIAGFLLIFNFFIAQATLTSAPATQPLYLLFFLNALIILDYIWKTRRKNIEKQKEKEEWKAW